MPRLLCALAALLAPSLAAAQPFAERLDPPALERGKTTRLKAVGVPAPTGLWSSLPAGALKVKAVEGGLDVTVSPDAPVGVFGLRVATGDGLGNAHLCLIDDLPVKAAPDSAKAPAKVTLPCALWGRFREAEVDRFAIDVKAGQSVSFEAVANRLGKEVDPLVTIRDGDGRVVAERDNDAGLYFDFRFGHRFDRAGTYVVEVRDARHQGHPHGSYVLRMGRFPAARAAVPAAVAPGKRARLSLPELNETLELDVPAAPPGPLSLPIKRKSDEASAWLAVEADDLPATAVAASATSPRTATPAAVPGQLCGVLGEGGAPRYFRLDLKKGQSIHVTGHGRAHDSPLDLTLTLTDDAGKPQRRANQIEDTARLDFTAPKDGVWCLGVGDLSRQGGPACAFRLEVRGHPPGPAVVAEAEGLTVPRGDYQPVPLKVTRNGHAGPIALSLAGAPAGVTLTPAEIPAGVDSVVCKLAASDAAASGLYTIQIVADPVGSKSGKSLVRTRPLIDRQRLNQDLIPYTLREDQTRLPASVADRLALMVVAPIPFGVELEKELVTLPRYQQAAVPIATTRKGGFAGPITFTARGGQLADKGEGRTRVYAEFPEATAKEPKVAGGVHSRILSNPGRTRIEVRAVATHEGRRVALLRTFDLEIRPAFSLATPPLAKAEAGGTVKLRVAVERLPSFAGPVRVDLSPAVGLECPERVTIPEGKDAVEVEVKVDAGAGPGRRAVSLHATGDVSGYEEEARGRLEVEVPPPPKKK